MYQVGKLSVSLMKSFKDIFLRWREEVSVYGRYPCCSPALWCSIDSPAPCGGEEHASATCRFLTFPGSVRNLLGSSGQGTGRSARSQDQGPVTSLCLSLHRCPTAQPREEGGWSTWCKWQVHFYFVKLLAFWDLSTQVGESNTDSCIKLYLNICLTFNFKSLMHSLQIKLREMDI